jgi:enoyl-CoA hydratase
MLMSLLLDVVFAELTTCRARSSPLVNSKLFFDEAMGRNMAAGREKPVAAGNKKQKPAVEPVTRSYRDILFEVKDQVAWVTINRPRVLNAFREHTLDELIDALKSTREDPSIVCAVVTGAGDKAFSAGADIREFVEPLVPTQFRDQRRRLDFRQVMERCPQPIIAAIRGVALGGGLELALACDLRIAGDDALLGLTEVNLAIIPGGGGTQRLPRLVGRGKALEMILTGARIDAAEALRIGLVERVVPAAEVMTAARGLARELAGRAPVAMRYAKEAVVKGLGMSLEDGLRLEGDLSTLLRTTEDRLEGARAFLEKRKPDWKGR